MKLMLFSTLFAVFCIAIAGAQTSSSGIFRTAEDFMNDKLEYASQCDSPSSKIKTEKLFKRNQVIIKHKGEAYKINKENLYAIRYCTGAIERLFQGKTYPMVNPGEEILMYKINIDQIGKSQPAQTKWYFSKSASWAIQPLTIGNLLGAFPDNHAFHDAIMAEFKFDSELARYDPVHKMMRINRLYKNTKTNQNERQ